MNLMRLYSLGLGPNELVIDIYKALPTRTSLISHYLYDFMVNIIDFIMEASLPSKS